jgi:hypothetical protein
MTASSQRATVVVLRGDNAEFLRQALGAGLLNGEAQQAAEAVMAECDRLRRENAILKGRLSECRSTIKSYRETTLDALNHQYDVETGWRFSRGRRWQMIFAAVGVTIALTCLACSLAITL